LSNGAKEKSKEIAKKLLKMNMPIKQIIEATELTQEEINKLK
jgi:predicted transposase/invertase (TIGR01784 family)